MNGQLPFEGDTFIPNEIKKLRHFFSIVTAIETGSQYGATLEWLMTNFNHAEGCEINQEFYSTCKEKKLNISFQNSEIFIASFFSRFNHKSTPLIYIDSHWHDTPCPLKNELKLLAEIKIKPVIVIHDFKVPNHPELGFDSYDYELRFEEIESLLHEIYPDGFDYHYNSEANGAMRGCIFIYPKLSK